MNISPVNNINFGKKPVMTCIVKTLDNKKQNATLYLMDRNSDKDRAEVKNDISLIGIKNDFLGLSSIPSASKFYVLRDDNSGEVISYAETHRRQKHNDLENSYTIIEELKGNGNYIDSLTPVVAQIAADAYKGSDYRIETSFRREDAPTLGRQKFQEGKNEEWVMSKRGFNDAMQRAELKNAAEFKN